MQLPLLGWVSRLPSVLPGMARGVVGTHSVSCSYIMDFFQSSLPAPRLSPRLSLCLSPLVLNTLAIPRVLRTDVAFSVSATFDEKADNGLGASKTRTLSGETLKLEQTMRSRGDQNHRQIGQRFQVMPSDWPSTSSSSLSRGLCVFSKDSFRAASTLSPFSWQRIWIIGIGSQEALSSLTWTLFKWL